MTDALRKRLFYQATHRGTKEADLVLGHFVEKHLKRFSEAECKELEKVLSLPDEVLMSYLLQNGPAPSDHSPSLLSRMRDETESLLSFKKKEGQAIIGNKNEDRR